MRTLTVCVYFPPQGDEGFPGFPGTKVTENTDTLSENELEKYRVALYILNLPFDVAHLNSFSFLHFRELLVTRA